MITIEERADIYLKSKLVLFGAGIYGKELFRIFKLFGIEVIAICDNDKNLHGKVIENTSIISPTELYRMVQQDTSIVVQVAIKHTDDLENAIVAQLREGGVENYLMYSKEILYSLDFMHLNNMCSANIANQYIGSAAKDKIRITKIDQELSIYCKNQVVLCGTYIDDNLIELFDYHRINIVAFCDLNENTVELQQIKGIELITASQLAEELERNQNIVIQSASLRDEMEVADYMKKVKVIYYVGYQEAYEVLSFIKNCRSGLQFSTAIDWGSKRLQEVRNNRVQSYIMNNGEEDLLFICMVAKTGDYTLGRTFEKNDIKAQNTAHNPEIFDEIKRKRNNGTRKIKVITAVRDPIAQYLSLLYHSISICGQNDGIQKKYFPFALECFTQNGGDVQYMFDEMMKEIKSEKTPALSNIGKFMRRFDNNIINTIQEPFNQEDGWSIIKEGNIEVFIYQLERMNDIIGEISEFVGTPFTKWEMENIADDKWISKSYKEAQKKIKMPKEFLELCYEDVYVRHFYNGEDIKKFKAKWENNIY